MTIERIINSDCVIQKRKDPLTRGAGTESIAYMPVQLNSTQLNSSLAPISPPKVAMVQLVKVNRVENIPVLSGRLVVDFDTSPRERSGTEQIALRMLHLEGRVVVDRENCNLVVTYCHSDSGLNVTFV